MSFAFEQKKNTPVGIATTRALQSNAAAVLAAARAGESPVRVIAPAIEHHLGNQQVNALVGRMIREWLGPNFRLMGRKKWPRERGTESGAIYSQAA